MKVVSQANPNLQKDLKKMFKRRCILVNLLHKVSSVRRRLEEKLVREAEELARSLIDVKVEVEMNTLSSSLYYPDNIRVADRLLTVTDKQGNKYVKNGLYNNKKNIILLCAESASDVKEKLEAYPSGVKYLMSDLDRICHSS